MVNVTIWNEYIHEKTEPLIAEIYPEGIHGCLANFLKTEDMEVTTATLDMLDHGLTNEVLANTDVLIWWGHCAHHLVNDEIVKRVCDCVLKGMGLIVLHSGHNSKPFMKLMGTTCNLLWRENDRERLWCLNPSHPIAEGVPAMFELPEEEMYGEFFDIPKPDDIIYAGWFKGGELFRSGCTFTRGYGKIFYFQPGHESYPIYYNENIQKILKNAVRWAKPANRIDTLCCYNVESLEG